MRKICEKMEPKLLSDNQKARKVQVCDNTLENIENDPELLTKVITRDETWVFEYDPETKPKKPPEAFQVIPSAFSSVLAKTSN